MMQYVKGAVKNGGVRSTDHSVKIVFKNILEWEHFYQETAENLRFCFDGSVKCLKAYSST